jgi:hypothetical protein
MSDIPKKIHVVVGRAEIISGTPEAETCCPIALALRQAFPDSNINVSAQSVRIDNLSYPLPKPAAQFVTKFDQVGTDAYEDDELEHTRAWRNEFEPFEFDLEAEEE